MPQSILQALKDLLLAGLALVTSLSGTAGNSAGHAQPPKAEKRQVTVVPRLPADEVLTVDENQDANQTGDVGEQETEEVDQEDLDQPVSTRYVTLRGPITSRPADGVIGTWTIAGRQVEVTAQTHVSARAANAKVGDWAQAQAEEPGATQPTAAPSATPPGQPSPLVAHSLAVMSSDKMARIVGPIESLDAGTTTAGSAEKVWLVSGVRVRVTAETHIVGTPEVGRLADVHGTMPAAEDGGLVAKEIIVRGTPNQPKPKEHGRKFDLAGLVESIDADTGAWVVAGQTVLVNEDTVLNEKKGKAEVGAMVRVQAEEDENGALVATSIEVVRGVRPAQPRGTRAATPEPDEAGQEPVQQTRPGAPVQGRGQGSKD